MRNPDHLNESIEELAALHQRADQDVSVHQRRIERVTAGLGRPSFLYGSTVFVAAWLGTNKLLPALGVAAFDPPPFDCLHLILTFTALAMATMVLVTQNRQMQLADRRSHLDLQINLLAERKVAKVIALLEELRVDLPNVPNRKDAEAQDMATRTRPDAVLEALEESVQQEPKDAPENSRRKER